MAKKILPFKTEWSDQHKASKRKQIEIDDIICKKLPNRSFPLHPVFQSI